MWYLYQVFSKVIGVKVIHYNELMAKNGCYKNLLHKYNANNILIHFGGRKMQEMWNLLNSVKDEPEKYIGEPSLERLFIFWCGMVIYSLIEKNAGVKSFPGFREFVCERYKDPGIGYSFWNIIRMNSLNENNAFYNFYKLLEEFLDEMDDDYQLFAISESGGEVRY